MTKPLTRIWTGLLAGAAFLLAWHPITTPDLFFHLSLGRAVWRAGSRVVAEPTAFAELAGPRVVPQWLWDVAAYLLYDGLGPTALVVVTMAIAGLATWLLCRLVAALGGGEAPAAEILVAGLATVAILMRTAARPQAMFMLLLPAAMGLAWHYASARGRRRVSLGVGWVVLLLFWAQVHGSFVLALLIGLLIVAPSYWEDREGRLQWRVDAVVLAGSVLALLTNAYGPAFLPYILAHGSGDAVRHNTEMMAPTWATLTSSLLPTLVWLLGAFGAARGGRVRWRELGLFALGVALAVSAQRFNAAATILAAPLALSGASNLDRWARNAWPGSRRVAPVLSLAVVAFTFHVWVSTSERVRGPFGRAGLTQGAHPIMAWSYLQRLPPGTNVLADYQGGAALAYFADGHVRTYVDGRTPLHFDDTDLAVYRDMGEQPDVLRRSIARYGVSAVVFDRHWRGCARAAQLWTPVVVEARYTTFVPPGSGKDLEGIEPCGRKYLRPGVCRDVEALDRSIARSSAIGPSPFVQLLRAERILRCGGDVAEARALLPDERDAFAFGAAHRRARIRLLLAGGDLGGASDLMEEALETGDNSVLEILLSPRSPAVAPERRRAILEMAVRHLDDDAPTAVRVALANGCRAVQDVECVRFHALRAALQGDPSALPALRWASKQHPDERIREDLRGWLRVLAPLRASR